MAAVKPEVYSEIVYDADIVIEIRKDYIAIYNKYHREEPLITFPNYGALKEFTNLVFKLSEAAAELVNSHAEIYLRLYIPPQFEIAVESNKIFFIYKIEGKDDVLITFTKEKLEETVKHILKTWVKIQELQVGEL